MKYILLSISIILSPFALAVTDLEVPLEMDSFQIEFSDISKTGIIRVKGCKNCKKEIYAFSDKTVIKHEGQVVTPEQLLNEYNDARYPTIFLELNSDTVVRINY